jgi:hypothetical protein
LPLYFFFINIGSFCIFSSYGWLILLDIMSHICLLTLCGLPAAGKTTFAKSFAYFTAQQQGIETNCCKESVAQKEFVQYHVLHVVYDELLPDVLFKPDVMVSIDC